VGPPSPRSAACDFAFLLATLAGAGRRAGAAERTVHERKARELFAKAISIPTSQGLGKVPELANYLAGEFRKGGFPRPTCTCCRWARPPRWWCATAATAAAAARSC
jgi:hypothetical protein